MKLSQLVETKITNFKPFAQRETGYNGMKEWTGGSVTVKFDGKEWFFTGKVGKNVKSDKQSFEYSNKDDGEARIWVTVDGEVIKD